MKEFLIFLLIFLIVASVAMIIFNGRFVYSQIKYSHIGLPSDSENGTMVIMGHSSAYPWYSGSYGSIFALLNKLNIGDEFTVFSKNKSFIYRVESKEIKAPKDLIFQKDKDNSVLYLVSCWPINTAWKRIVIKTVQVLDK
ncbi:MAG: sortase [Candidatus Portnoybacteria bacterium]|nr:sortase [Candidatus Portnoybacteria bacterium]